MLDVQSLEELTAALTLDVRPCCPRHPRDMRFLFGMISMPNMTGRPGCRTMATNGGSSASYLARTPCVPLYCTLFNRGGKRRAFRVPGREGNISIAQWNLHPVIFGVESSRSWSVPERICRQNMFPVWLLQPSPLREIIAELGSWGIVAWFFVARALTFLFA